MAKNSGGEKLPFFQEARLEITICIKFRSFRLSELLAKQICHCSRANSLRTQTYFRLSLVSAEN